MYNNLKKNNYHMHYFTCVNYNINIIICYNYAKYMMYIFCTVDSQTLCRDDRIG